MIFQEIYTDIVDSFGSLWGSKVRGNTLEIITPFASTNHKFISVFLTKSNDEYIITDGGWLESNEYEVIFSKDEDAIQKILFHYSNAFNISVTKGNGLTYYYKKTNNQLLVSSLVFDVAHFISSLVSISNIQFTDSKEEASIKRFQSEANNYISAFVREGNVKFSHFIDNEKTIKVNALYTLAGGSKLILINYITGTNLNNFNASIYKTDFVFGMSNKSTLSKYIKLKIALVNNNAEGYHPQKSMHYINYLVDSTNATKVDWSQREQLESMLN
jgi:hypothetical protein